MNVNLELGAGAPDVIRQMKELRDGMEQLRQKEQELQKATADRAATGQQASAQLLAELAKARKDLELMQAANDKLAASQRERTAEAVAGGSKVNENIERQTRTVKTLEEALGRAQAKQASPAVINNLTAAIEKQKSVLAQLKAEATGAGGLLSPEELGRLKDQLLGAKNDMEALAVILDHTKTKMEGMDSGTNAFVELQKEVEAAEKIMQQFTGETDGASESQKSLRIQLRDLTMQMAELKLAGKDNTEEYARLRAEAGELRDTIGDVQEEINLAGSDTGGFDNLLNVVNAVTGSFAVAQGAAALFGEENEDVQEALLKVNAAMSILSGLQAVQTELARKDSAIRTAGAVVQDLWNKRIMAGTIAQRAFNTTLLLSGIGVIIGLIAVAVNAYKNWSEAAEKQRNQQKLLNDVYEAARGEYEQVIASVNRVRNAIQEAKTGIISKKEAVAIYNNTLGDAIGKVDTLEKAEASLNSKADQYIQYTLKKAVATQALQQAASKAVEAQLLQNKSVVDEMSGFQKFLTGMGLANGTFAGFDYGSKLLQNAADNRREALQQLKDDQISLEQIAKDSQAAADALGKKLGIDITDSKETKSPKDKTDEERKKNLNTLKAFLKQEEDARVESIQEAAERERAALVLSFEKQQQTLREGYDALLKSKYISEAQKTELTRSFEKQRNDISAGYATKAVELEKQIAEALLATRAAGLKVMLELDADVRKKQLAEAAEAYKADREALEKAGLLTAETEAQLLERRRNKERDIEIAFQESQLKSQQEAAERSLEMIDISGKDAEKKTEAKEKLKLAIEQNFARRRLDMLSKQYGLEADLTEENIAKYRQYLETFAKEGKTPLGILEFLGVGKDLTDKDKGNIEGAVTQASKVATDKAKVLGPNSNFFTNLFGLSDKQAEGLSTAYNSLQESFAAITSIMAQEVQAQMDLIDQRIAKIDELAEAQQEAVDREKELADAGLANTYQAEKDRLASIKKSKDDEVAQKQDLQRKLTEIRKQEAIAKSIEIGASTALTTAKLLEAAADAIKSTAGIPFVGVALGIAAAAALVAGFMQIKATMDAANRAPQFRKGGEASIQKLLRGQPSHEEGGVGLYSEKTGKKLAEFEGGEDLFVINKGATSKYAGLLDEINRDQISAATLMRYLKPTDVVLNTDAFKSTAKVMSRNNTPVQPVQSGKLSPEHNEYLRRLAFSNEALLDIERQRTTEETLPDGTRVVKSYNSTRVIKP